MKIPSPENSYAFLASCLSPWQAAETTDALREVFSGAAVDWQSLLYMANLQVCTPLWFVRLRRDGLLPLLPADLQDYLAQLHQANVERNEVFRKTAKEILAELEDLGIPVILLKGAATFCDDLYGDLGARMMADIDVLVPPQHTEPVKKRLLQRGYQELPETFENPGWFNAYAPHHLAPLHKPGTSVVVEVHFQTARGQAGRTLPAEMSWQHTERHTSNDLAGVVLAPTYRLLHNTVHALVPSGKFVRSNVSLAHLAEFAHLARRYGRAIDWTEWFERGRRQGLSRPFRVYLNLAHRLMAVPLPHEVPRVRWAPIPTTRISVAADCKACLYGHQNPPCNMLARAKWVIVGIYAFFYSRLARPAWVWHNLCYRKGTRYIPTRVFHLLASFRTQKKPKEPLDKAVRRGMVAKVVHLLKKPNRS